MREIKFRGKRKNGEWVYGFLADEDVICKGTGYDDYIEIILINAIEVIPETVGQFTGIKDKNGIEIYEGDILMRDRKTIFTPHAEPQIALVYYDINKARFWVKDKNIDLKFFDMRELNDFEKIGNVFDNPELLKKETNNE